MDSGLAALDVLIVDDNAHMRALIRTVLRSVGVAKLRECGDAEEAWALLERRTADVILLDYAMPGMDGLQFLKKLRADRDSPAPHARVVMITGYGDMTRVNAARDAGADEFLTKPLTANSLLSRLDSVASRPRAFIETDDFLGPDRRRKIAEPPSGADRRVCEQGQLVEI